MSRKTSIDCAVYAGGQPDRRRLTRLKAMLRKAEEPPVSRPLVRTGRRVEIIDSDECVNCSSPGEYQPQFRSREAKKLGSVFLGKMQSAKAEVAPDKEATSAKDKMPQLQSEAPIRKRGRSRWI